jgi:hypothetical protein
MGKSCPFAHFISQATQRAQWNFLHP